MTDLPPPPALATLAELDALAMLANWRIGDINTNPAEGVLGEIAILADTSLVQSGTCCPLVVLPFDGGSSRGRKLALDIAGQVVALVNAYRAARLTEAAPEWGWMPIETAPRDGTKVWGYCPKLGQRETYMTRYQPGSPGFAQYGPTESGWRWTEDYHNWASSWKPTHWQPLPPPPRASEGGDQ